MSAALHLAPSVIDRRRRRRPACSRLDELLAPFSELMSPSEVASALGLPIAAVAELLRAGELVTASARRLTVRKIDLRAFLLARACGPRN